MSSLNDKNKIFVIAEAGVNHNGDVSLAKRLIDVAKEAGADAVKFQTYKTEKLVTKGAPKAGYQIQNAKGHESQFEMLKKLELSFDAFRRLQLYSIKKRILFLSTPFDEESADFLISIDIPLFKISSGEITNLPFLNYIASKKRPIILSTGMSTLGEVKKAVQTIKKAGNKDLTLLHCVSAYPADPRDANLKAMLTLQKTFHLPVGFSDHTPGITVSLAAVALGASVIEKHFTLDKEMPGPDHQASLDPVELKLLVQGIRVVEQSLGSGKKEPRAVERNVSAVARKSLVAAANIPEGCRLLEKWIAIRRPGSGLPPSDLAKIVGKKAKKKIAAGAVLKWEMFE